MPAARFRGRFGADGDLPHGRSLTPKIRRNLLRVTLLNGDGSIYNRMDLHVRYLHVLKDNAERSGNAYRHSKKVVVVQSKGRFDAPRKAASRKGVN